MMKFIAHRGNVDGRHPRKENSFEHINSALDKGFDVEADVWFINGSYYSGHDSPNNDISLTFLLMNAGRLWCHAKDVWTLNELLKYDQINCFFHQGDDCTLTSHGHIWTYPGKPLTERSILLKFERDEDFTIQEKITGICSDNIKYYQEKFMNLCFY
jgi:hypothetical protein